MSVELVHLRLPPITLLKTYRILLLSTPPNSKLHAGNIWTSKLSQNGQTRRMEHIFISIVQEFSNGNYYFIASGITVKVWITWFCLTFIFSFSAYYNDIIVGAVCCRIDVIDGQRRLYIMTLGCLAPYRGRGIGTKMLEHVLNYVEKDGNFDSIFL